jgi:hypothetical protein
MLAVQSNIPQLALLRVNEVNVLIAQSMECTHGVRLPRDVFCPMKVRGMTNYFGQVCK